MAEQAIRVEYTNYRGETAVRSIVPKHLFWGSTEWHQENQWLLWAFDIGKGADRAFALRDMNIRKVPQ